MQITHPHTLLILAWLAIGQLCTGCSAEDIAGEAPSEMGVLCLQMSSDEVFIETRAVNDYEWAFQITGDNYSNNNVELGKDISIPAGQYTFSATNADAVENGYGGPLYEGSIIFDLEAGEHKTIELDLGKPQNAKITLILTDNFEAAYENVGLKKENSDPILLSEGEHFFPKGDYTITANAKSGSGVQEFINNSTITLEAGTHTTLTLDVNPIDGYIRIESGGDYDDEFQ